MNFIRTVLRSSSASSRPRRGFTGTASFVGLVMAAFIAQGLGQDQTLEFDMDGPGVDKPMKTWGVQTIGGPGVVQSALDHMGAKNIQMILIPYPVKEPLSDKGRLPRDAQAQLDGDLATAKLAGRKPLFLSPDTEGGVHEWFHTGPGRVNADHWAEYLLVLKKSIRRFDVGWIQPFNEPDWAQWNQGSQQDLHDIMTKLAADRDFAPTRLAGPAVLNVDVVMEWYRPIKDLVALGTMHTLNGSAESYINFIKDLRAGGKVPFNPEMHNLVEAIIGGEYGLEGGIWWMNCTEARGTFVKACGWKRLGYAEDRAKWSAAAVYRESRGSAWAFLGSNERTGQNTTYKLVCRDREVRFDGKGPMKEFTVTIEKDKEMMIKITR